MLTMWGMVDMMPIQISVQSHKDERLSEIMDCTETLLLEIETFVSKLVLSLKFLVESGAITSLYHACVYTTDVEFKNKVIILMSECTFQKGPWDVKLLVRLLQVYNARNERMQRTQTGYQTLPRWVSNIGCHRMFCSLC